jgi:hypothetical protein
MWILNFRDNTDIWAQMPNEKLKSSETHEFQLFHVNQGERVSVELDQEVTKFNREAKFTDIHFSKINVKIC